MKNCSLNKSKSFKNPASYCSNHGGHYHQLNKDQKEQDNTLTIFTTDGTGEDGRQGQPFPNTRWEWRQSRTEVLHVTRCLRKNLKGAGIRAPQHFWMVSGNNWKSTGWVISSYLKLMACLPSTLPDALEVPLADPAWSPPRERANKAACLAEVEMARDCHSYHILSLA